jgi:large subunit ribosomal protein L13
MKTYSPKPRDIQRRWYVIDASGAVLGRLATEVASILRGKHKPIFAPHMDTGDHVIVVNAKGVRLTGGKEGQKIAYRHSGYPGGLTATPYERLLQQKPHFAVEKAVKGMLPKNRLGRAMAKKLQVYPGPDHPHRAQQPQPLKLGEVPTWDGLPKPEPKETKPASREARPAAKASTAKRSTAKTTAKRTATSAAGPAAKPVAKSAAKRSTPKATAKSAAKTTAKSTAKKTTAKSTAKRATARRKKKED